MTCFDMLEKWTKEFENRPILNKNTGISFGKNIKDRYRLYNEYTANVADMIGLKENQFPEYSRSIED